MFRKWFKQGASLRWEDVFEWAKAHGAPNDRIVSIEIVGPNDYPSVRMTGFAVDDSGRPYLSGRDEVARWEASSILRYLP